MKNDLNDTSISIINHNRIKIKKHPDDDCINLLLLCIIFSLLRGLQNFILIFHFRSSKKKFIVRFTIASNKNINLFIEVLSTQREFFSSFNLLIYRVILNLQSCKCMHIYSLYFKKIFLEIEYRHKLVRSHQLS